MVINPIVTPDFMAPVPRGPISRMAGNAPGAGGTGPGAPESSLSLADLVLQNTFLTDPGASWRTTDGFGSGGNFADTGAIPNQGSLGYPANSYRITDAWTLTHSASGPAAGTGYLRSTVQSGYAFNEASARPLYGAATHLSRSGVNLRDCRHRFVWRHGAGYTNTDQYSLIGKWQYYETNNKAEMSDVDRTNFGGTIRTGSATSDFTYDSATGKWTGTVTTGLGVIPRGTNFIIHGAVWGTDTDVPIMLDSYDSATGACVFFAYPHMSYVASPISDTQAFTVFADAGDSFTFSAGGGGDLVGFQYATGFDAKFMHFLNATGMSGHTPSVTTGTLTFSGGLTVSNVTFDFIGDRQSVTGLSEPSNTGAFGRHLITAGKGEALVLASPTGGGVDGGVYHAASSPWNLAANDLDFFIEDHTAEWVEMCMVVKTSESPWVFRMYITNQDAIDVHGLAEGTAQNIGGVNHFNRALLWEFQYYLPAVDSSVGFEIEGAIWGGGGLDQAYQVGWTFDSSLGEVADGYGDGAYPFGTPFVPLT